MNAAPFVVTWPKTTDGSMEAESNLATLRAALIEGEASGPPTPFDFDAFIAERLRAIPTNERDRSGN